MGSRRRAHRRTEMAIANEVVQLIVRELEEALRLAVAVIFQTGCSENWIIKRDRYRRTVAAHCVAFRDWLMFRLVQRRQGAGGIAFEKLRPALKAFNARGSAWVVLIDLGDSLQLLNCMVLHLGLLFRR